MHDRRVRIVLFDCLEIKYKKADDTGGELHQR